MHRPMAYSRRATVARSPLRSLYISTPGLLTSTAPCSRLACSTNPLHADATDNTITKSPCHAAPTAPDLHTTYNDMQTRHLFASSLTLVPRCTYFVAVKSHTLHQLKGTSESAINSQREESKRVGKFSKEKVCLLIRIKQKWAAILFFE